MKPFPREATPPRCRPWSETWRASRQWFTAEQGLGAGTGECAGALAVQGDPPSVLTVCLSLLHH